MGHRVSTPGRFFDGRCEETIAFYRDAIGAQREFLILFEESPEPMPPRMRAPGFEKKVMHASVRIGPHVVMASDGCGPGATSEGFSLTPTIWSALYGMLKDRYGVHRMVMAESPAAARSAG